METLPHGELHFKTISTKRIDPPITQEERPGTTSWPPAHDKTTQYERLCTSQLLYRHAQLELEQEIETATRKHLDVANEDLPTPSFMAGTYILIRNADRLVGSNSGLQKKAPR